MTCEIQRLQRELTRLKWEKRVLECLMWFLTPLAIALLLYGFVSPMLSLSKMYTHMDKYMNPGAMEISLTLNALTLIMSFYNARTFYRLFVQDLIKKFDAQSCPTGKTALLLWTFLPREGRAAAIGDLAEEFEIIEAQHGTENARKWYRGQVLASMVPCLVGIVDKFIQWGTLGAVSEWLRRRG